MKNAIDSSYFIELAEKNPDDVCRLALCDYDPIKKGYRISVWGEKYGIYPNESKIIRLKDDNPDVSCLLGLFILIIETRYENNIEGIQKKVRTTRWSCT
jgi:hypothetical protein